MKKLIYIQPLRFGVQPPLNYGIRWIILILEDVKNLIGKRVRLINPGGYDKYEGSIIDSNPFNLKKENEWVDVKWDISFHPCTTPIELKHLQILMYESI